MINNPFLNKKYTLPLQNFLCIELKIKEIFELALINLTKSATLFIEKVVVEGIYMGLFNTANFIFFQIKNVFGCIKKIIPFFYTIFIIFITF